MSINRYLSPSGLRYSVSEAKVVRGSMHLWSGVRGLSLAVVRTVVLEDEVSLGSLRLLRILLWHAEMRILQHPTHPLSSHALFDGRSVLEASCLLSRTPCDSSVSCSGLATIGVFALSITIDARIVRYRF